MLKATHFESYFHNSSNKSYFLLLRPPSQEKNSSKTRYSCCIMETQSSITNMGASVIYWVSQNRFYIYCKEQMQSHLSMKCSKFQFFFLPGLNLFFLNSSAGDDVKLKIFRYSIFLHLCKYSNTQGKLHF